MDWDRVSILSDWRIAVVHNRDLRDVQKVATKLLQLHQLESIAELTLEQPARS